MACGIQDGSGYSQGARLSSRSFLQDFRFLTAMRELPRHGPVDRRFEAITHFSELEAKAPGWWNDLVGQCVLLTV